MALLPPSLALSSLSLLLFYWVQIAHFMLAPIRDWITLCGWYRPQLEALSDNTKNREKRKEEEEKEREREAEEEVVLESQLA